MSNLGFRDFLESRLNYVLLIIGQITTTHLDHCYDNGNNGIDFETNFIKDLNLNISDSYEKRECDIETI
tara:strand:- start:234 stop:440 length:207 start_codon:yes stop_codon:yes gene_type:complete